MTSECTSELDSQHRIRLSGLCSSAQAEVRFTPTDRWFESRSECSSFDHLCDLTVFILEVISKLCDVWKLWVLRWAQSDRSGDVSLKWCPLSHASRKTELGYLKCISRVGQRSTDADAVSWWRPLQVALLKCCLVSTSSPRWPLSYGCAAQPAAPHFPSCLSSATHAELVWRRKGKFVRMMKNSFYFFKRMFSFGNSNAKEHIWK